ncbi:uncharacterized protein [Anas platyrhynchos]|uniref:uncharacterized protein isoform X2 n=1 Tax=Anas platyrhynchos TaxID=8839 RepID=UPI0018D7C53B|nr:uncharacterized protein LOC101796723 isoform X2 [Anas platyrhynchos]
MALRWSLLLALTPLLAAEKMERDETGYRENRRQAGCAKPEWDSSLRFVPEKTSYDDGEELTLSCLTEDDPPLAVIRCVEWIGWGHAWKVKDKQGRWHNIEMYQACTGTCQKPLWDRRVMLVPRKGSYTPNEELRLSCPEGVKPSFTSAKCVREFQGVTSGEPVYGDSWWGRRDRGAWTRIEEPVACVVKCSRPQWDADLRLAPERDVYEEGEEVTLSCPEGSLLPFQQAKCAWRPRAVPKGEHKGTWTQKNELGKWVLIQSPTMCISTCQKPWRDPRLHLAPEQEVYKENEEVTLSCPKGFEPSFTHIKCSREVQSISAGKPVYREVWMGKDPGGAWTRIHSMVQCVGKCQKPHWDPRLIFVPDMASYVLNEVVMVRCPEGYWPPAMEMACVDIPGESSPTLQTSWVLNEGTDYWQPEDYWLCEEAFQVVPGTLEAFTTSIKLNWTCSLPDACQRMQATCRLAGPSSPSCEAEEVTGQEMLHGQNGTFTCDHLQPFTDYSVNISVPPSTILFTRLLRTKATVPEKPERLWLDASTGTLRWQALPSCKGEILGYQLNVTARSAQDGSFLEFQQVTVNSSVTQYTPPRQMPSSKYTVTVQGLTAAGAGDASYLEFQPSVLGQPPGPWPWTAVTVVAVLSAMVMLLAGILGFVMCRRRKALPRKAEEDHYTELQPYENSDHYCVIKERFLAEEEAGRGGRAGERPSPSLRRTLGDHGGCQRAETAGRTTPA